MSGRRVLTNEEALQILKERDLDIKERGENHPVYDKDGNISKLRDITPWYDEDYKYVKPQSTMSLDCCIS